MKGIYKITSPNGRIYIGQSVDIKKRFKYYQLGCKGQIRLENSFKKYGTDNHKFEIVEICNKEELNNRERYWQEYYNVLSKKGLNCVYVSTTKHSSIISKVTLNNMKKAQANRKPMSDEQKKKISESWKHRIVTKFTCEKISKAHLGKKKSLIHCKNISKGRLGIKFTEETKRKMSIKSPEAKQRIKELGIAMKKPVLQFTLDGVFIKEWTSASDAGKILLIPHQRINLCCHNKAQTAGGSKWVFK